MNQTVQSAANQDFLDRAREFDKELSSLKLARGVELSVNFLPANFLMNILSKLNLARIQYSIVILDNKKIESDGVRESAPGGSISN